MIKYLKLFDTHTDYNTYITGQDKILPNVSYCENENEVHYNPFVPMNIITYEATTILPEGGIGQYGPKNGYNPTAFGTTLVSHTFENGKGKFTFEDDVTSIGNHAFYNCDGLTSVTIPNSVTTIGTQAFSGCSGLTSVTIPNSVTSMGNAAFELCTSLPIENDIRYADTYAVEAVDKTKTIYTLKEGTKWIGGSGTVSQSCFAQCSNLTNITIPNTVISIGNNVFNSCTSLTSITIGNSVTSIGEGVFNSCTSLTSITSLVTTAPTISSFTFQNIKTGGTLYVPIGSTGYDTWMGTGNYYLGKYNWTKVEQ